MRPRQREAECPDRLPGTSTGRLMLAVLGGLADVERDLIRTRMAEGRSRAKAQGKHMGRAPYANSDLCPRLHGSCILILLQSDES